MAADSVPFELSGRVAVVTGGSAGIGLGIAKVLGQAGAAVCLWARTEERLSRAATELVKQGIRTTTARCDVTVEEDVQRAMTATAEELGPPDILIANAGLSIDRIALVDTTLEEWDNVIRGNLTSTFLCFREAARHMIKGGHGGSLVAVSSASAVQASPGIHHYAAAKSGLRGLVRALAHELAPFRIRCNALIPGFTETNRVVPAAMSERRRREVAASIPAGRIGLPRDVGLAALYLADPSLPYHTGAAMVVDGGLCIMAAQHAATAAWDSSLELSEVAPS